VQYYNVCVCSEGNLGTDFAQPQQGAELVGQNRGRIFAFV